MKTETAVAAGAVTARAPGLKLTERKQLTAYGEPHAQAGKRLIFLNWHYIRTGSFGWREGGRKVETSGAVF